MVTKQKEPIRHHYVPRAFLKAWSNDKGIVNWSNKEVDRQVNISTIFYKKDLYRLSKQIEEDFITPFIDNNLFKYLEKIRNDSWDNLTSEDKFGIIKYFISLSARNPISLEKMKLDKNIITFLTCALTKSMNLDDKKRDDISIGLNNGNFFLMIFMMKDVGVTIENVNNMRIHKDTSYLLKTLTEMAELCGFNKLSYSDMIMKEIDNIIITEFNSNKNELVTTNYPILLEGISNEGINKDKFYILTNISPNKSIIISFDKSKILEEYNKYLNEDKKIEFFNEKLGKHKYCEQIVRKII